MIGYEIELSVLALTDSMARLGIDAPKTVRIVRSEIWEGRERPTGSDGAKAP